jgi:hypothetical protein
MRGPSTIVVSLAAAGLLLAGCGDSDDSTARDSATAAASASASASPSDDSGTRMEAVVAWLQDPDQGYQLSDVMATCEAQKLLASDVPPETVDKVVSPDVTATQAETNDFMAALGEADQACVEAHPDDPAAP